ncbi:MAG: 50S ribosomal protein L25 [Bacteroidales bacterium]|nr:50S ribosomal protein L25 [Bacteroidales bacterium]
METIAFKGTPREKTGKTPNKQLRIEKMVPCVLYGGKENLLFSVEESEFRLILDTPFTYFTDLQVGGNTYRAMLKDIQFHPVSDRVLHADFMQVFEDKDVTVDIPVKITGLSIGVKEGGKLILERRKIKLKGLPKDIPAEVPVDITNLALEKSIRCGDLNLQGIKVLETEATPIVSVRSTRASKSAAPEGGGSAEA